jgi:hypothetical protein
MSYAYFTEHLVGVIKKSPRKRHEELGKLKPYIRRLKNKADFHLQESKKLERTKTEVVVAKEIKDQNSRRH